MMKGIFLYMTMCVAAIAFAACTNELEESTVPADNALVLTVDGFPAFQETTETPCRGYFRPRQDRMDKRRQGIGPRKQ